MQWNRREFLKTGGLTALALGLNAFSPAIFRRRILAGPAVGDKKLVFIFQRGGNDGVNTLIPRGDSTYNATTRPTLYIPESSAIPLGNGFAQLHPAMAPLMEIYNSTALTGTPGPGNLALIHRVGYAGQSQSHFDSQQWWETGMPRSTSEEGMLYRQVVHAIDPAAANSLAAISVSSNQLVALKGPRALPTIRKPEDFSFAGSSSKVQKLLGRLPSAPVGPDGKGLLGVYGGPRDFPQKIYRDLVYGTGLALADAMNIVQDAIAQGPYTPEAGADYPDSSLGGKLRDVAMYLKRTPVRVLGVNIGGWDTHSNQGGEYGGHSRRLSDLSQGIQALYRDLQDQWENLVIITMTEFGRTSKENASFGTDHANACMVCVAGGSVIGGVYNCDPTTWADGDMFSRRDRYVERRTDYRQVFAEIFQHHFGDDAAMLNTVIPGYAADKAARDSEGKPDFTPLNFLA